MYQRLFIVVLLFVVVVSPAYADVRDNRTCGIENGQPLTNAYGPFDFRNPRNKSKVKLVVGAHFKKNIEQLKSSKNGKGTPHADIDYTLRALPNHHRALYAVAKLERIEKARIQKGEFFDRSTMYTAECYFKRAMYFQPKDPIPPMLYAMHLHILKQHELALNNYKLSLALNPDNPELHYNLGLLYVDIHNIELAKQHAKTAYDGGYPLAGLRNKIAEIETAPNAGE